MARSLRRGGHEETKFSARRCPGGNAFQCHPHDPGAEDRRQDPARSSTTATWPRSIPIWTTAPPTKDYAFLTFDQLLAVDSNYVPQPQMAEGWTVEDDGKAYVLGLREGLKFHDGEPVRSPDCIASIQRWGARDGFGQLMMKFVDSFETIDDRRFRIKLKKPFALLPAALGKSNSSQCFIMPERMAKVDPMKQVTETIGSGPYRFLKSEFVSGARAAWAKFDGYIPRKEPVDSIAGGRIPAVDRIEWSFISDPSTAMAALQAGEQDYWDAPTLDLVQVLKSRPRHRRVAAQSDRLLLHAAAQPHAAAFQQSQGAPSAGDGGRPERFPEERGFRSRPDQAVHQLLRQRFALFQRSRRRHPQDQESRQGQGAPQGIWLRRRKGRDPGRDGNRRSWPQCARWPRT